MSDKQGQILITEELIDDTEFVFVNLYSANTRNNLLTTFVRTDKPVRKFRSN